MLLRLFHFFLAFLVLVGSVGLPVSRHFCMGELKSIAIYGEAQKCHVDQAKQQCPFHPAPEGEALRVKKDCCDDELELIKIDDQEPTPALALPALVATFPLRPASAIHYPASPPRPRKQTSFENYRPPPLIMDAPAEFQVFRL